MDLDDYTADGGSINSWPLSRAGRATPARSFLGRTISNWNHRMILASLTA